MSSGFLLYIDILGFAEMARREPHKVVRLYAILDSLRAHQLGEPSNMFKTVVFSNTVLVYNSTPAETEEDSWNSVWYLIEFAEDLNLRLTGQDIFFRAVLTTGSFSYYNLKNIECFFGEALITAYLRGKNIPSIGLFIDEPCNKYNRCFRTVPFDKDLSFVYLNRQLEGLSMITGGQFPVEGQSGAIMFRLLPWHIRFLKDVHSLMRTHPTPQVRIKFSTAWGFYKQRYPGMLRDMEQSEFSLPALVGNNSWQASIEKMERDIKYFML